MTQPRASLLLSLAAGVLFLAALDDRLVALLERSGFGTEALDVVSPWFAVVLAAVALVLTVAGVASFLSGSARDQRRAPYVAVLKPFAAEFGRGVREAGDSLEFEALRDGQRVEVLVDLRPGGGIAVRSSPPARQSLSWFRPPAAAPSRAAGWREVERTERWQLRAELPAMARPLLADTGLMEVVHAFFTSHLGTAVTHTLSGMEIDAELAPVDAVGAQVRVCVEMAFRLRRLNG
jgi:hypothetical protein